MKWIYQGISLRKYLSTIIEDPSDLTFLYVMVTAILKKEYTEDQDMNSLIDDVLTREKIQKIITGKYEKGKKTSWYYHKVPLKEYLKDIIQNKEELAYLYDAVKRILEKEYTEGQDMDLLIDDILNRDKIKKTIQGEYQKKECNVWRYHKAPLNVHLYELLKNKEDLTYLYNIVAIILKKEYTKGQDMDLLIDDILNRPRIQDIINGTYSKKEEVEWVYQGMTLVDYVHIHIKSPYRNEIQICSNIRGYVSDIIKKENLDMSKREELIGIYLSSPQFEEFLSTTSRKKAEYIYQGMKLRNYIKQEIKNKDNLQYVYNIVWDRIQSIYPEMNPDLDSVINSVMESEEIQQLLDLDEISRMEREVWPYKGGLLIDYLKTIDLNGKKLRSVYNTIRGTVQRSHEEGFSSLQEKENATIEFLDSEEFQHYLKYGFTNKNYIYSGMLLIDYLKIYYEDLLKKADKNIEDLYRKIICMTFNDRDISNLSEEEIEREIDITLRSNEIREYLHLPKRFLEDWSCHGEKLKDMILREYSAGIEEKQDVIRIYESLVKKAKKIKQENPNADNDTVLSTFFTKEFIETFLEEYFKRRKIQNEVHQKTKLYENREDFQYIDLYAKENELDITEIVKLTNLGFNYYSAIIILEYARKFDKPVDEVVQFTLNMDRSENTSLLWLVKLGFKDYILNVMESNKGIIHVIANQKMHLLYKRCLEIDEEDLRAFLMEQLVKRFIVITVPIEYLFMSFKAFISKCTETYLRNMNHYSIGDRKYNLDDEKDSWIQPMSEDDTENDFLENETASIIMDALDTLDHLEKEFIDLRYGFSGDENNLTQIHAIWNAKGIIISMDELERLDKTVLEKLRKNPKILEIKQSK